MNELKHLEEFKKVLASYNVSDESKQILKNIKLALLLAPTSAGRNTIVRELVKTGDFYYIVSDTTRRPRVNDGALEQNGVQYWFRTEKEVLEDLKSGKFLEAEIIHHQQVSGISVRELEKTKNEQKIAITDIDLQGAQNILAAKPDTVVILVLPPGFEEWQRRITVRGEMAGAEYRRRLQTAERIFTTGLKDQRYKIVINDQLDKAVGDIKKLAQNEAPDSRQQTAGRRLLENLLKKLKALGNN